jgi:hypothetical protein
VNCGWTTKVASGEPTIAMVKNLAPLTANASSADRSAPFVVGPPASPKLKPGALISPFSAAPAYDLNNARVPGLCPMPMLAMTHHWPARDAWVCAQCNQHVRARRAWLDDLPLVDDPFQALSQIFSDPRA